MGAGYNGPLLYEIRGNEIKELKLKIAMKSYIQNTQKYQHKLYILNYSCESVFKNYIAGHLDSADL